MKGWPTKPLREVAECLDGRRVPITAEDRTQGDVPYYGANGQVGWIDKPIFNEPLLLIAEDGGHFDQPEKGVAYLISGPSWVNNHAHVIRANASKVHLAFLGHYFRHFNFIPFVTGTTRAKLNQKILMSVPVPVPPLPEQERIVKLLDEADELRKLRAQADRRAAGLVHALFHGMFGDPATNPKGFRKEPLEKLIRIKSGDFLPAKNMDIGGEFPVYGGNGISGYHSTSMFEQPVIVIGRVGVYCGVVHLSEPKSWVTDNALYVCELKEDIDQQYLVAALRVANLNQYAGRAAQPLVSGSRIYPIPILIPPLPLQKEFAQRVTEIRELAASQATSRTRLDALFQSMLHRAFNGEL
jgi:type I restriction enzyme S subunit